MKKPRWQWVFYVSETQKLEIETNNLKDNGEKIIDGFQLKMQKKSKEILTIYNGRGGE